MGLNKPEEIMEIIQAFIRGEQIQYWNEEDKKWVDCSRPVWSFNATIYRIKPNPRIIFMNEYRNSVDGSTYFTSSVHYSKEDADFCASSSCIRCVKFVEVVED